MESGSAAFARLLRQSRLSAHHPAQVYAAPAAFASRGDFGVKKPLPITSSEAADYNSLGKLRYIEISKQESSQGQTEWRENERDTLFVKRWQEKNARLNGRQDGDAAGSALPSSRAAGSLGPRIRTVFDPATYRPKPSDFPDNKDATETTATLRNMARTGSLVPGGHDDPFSSSSTLYSRHLDLFPNYRKMSEREFNKFLSRVRNSRTTLRKQLRTRMEERMRHAVLAEATRTRERALRAQSDAQSRGATLPTVADLLPDPSAIKLPPIRTDLWDEARAAESIEVRDFLKKQQIQKNSKPRSTLLPFQQGTRAQTHPTQGLQYAQPDEIFTQRLAEAQQGRVIISKLPDLTRSQIHSPTVRNSDLGVASGGHVEQLPMAVKENLIGYNPYTPNTHRSESRFRVISASMEPRMWSAGLPKEAVQNQGLGYVKARIRPSNETAVERPVPGSTAFVGAQASSSSNDRNLGGSRPRGLSLASLPRRTSMPRQMTDPIAADASRAGVKSMLDTVSKVLRRPS